MFMHLLLFTKLLAYVFENLFRRPVRGAVRRRQQVDFSFVANGLMLFCKGQTLYYVMMYVESLKLRHSSVYSVHTLLYYFQYYDASKKKNYPNLNEYAQVKDKQALAASRRPVTNRRSAQTGLRGVTPSTCFKILLLLPIV